MKKLNNSTTNLLEKNLEFIIDEHKIITKSLIEEINQLKHKRRELQFCLLKMIQDHNPLNIPIRKKNVFKENSTQDKEVMTDAVECSFDKKIECNHIIDNPSMDFQQKIKYEEATRLEEIRMLFLEQEAEDYKQLIAKIKSENEKLTRLVKYKQPSLPQRMNMLEVVEESQVSTDSHATTSVDVIPLNCDGLPFEMTLDPFLIHDHPPRPPTVAECQLVLHRLAVINKKQNHELNQLTSDLQDILSAKSLDPDAFFLPRKLIPKFSPCISLFRNPLVTISRPIPEEKHPNVTNHIHPEFKNSLSLRNFEKFKYQNKHKNTSKNKKDEIKAFQFKNKC